MTGFSMQKISYGNLPPPPGGGVKGFLRDMRYDFNLSDQWKYEI